MPFLPRPYRAVSVLRTVPRSFVVRIGSCLAEPTPCLARPSRGRL